MACLPNDVSVVLGYLVSEPQIIHYVFVKESFRRFGIARMLFDHEHDDLGLTECTHKTFISDEIIRNHGLVYNPFLLFKRGLDEIS